MKQAKKNKERTLFLIRSRWTYPISRRTINWVYKHGVVISFGEMTTPIPKEISNVVLDNNK